MDTVATPIVDINSTSRCIQLSKVHLDGTGLCPGNRDLLLYRRPELENQIRFMTNVGLTRFQSYIYGPSGVGKGITALAFALSLDRKKYRITWIKLKRGAQENGVDPVAWLVVYDGDFRKVKTLRYFYEVDKYINADYPSKFENPSNCQFEYELLFIVGIRISQPVGDERQARIEKAATYWLQMCSNRRLFMVYRCFGMRMSSEYGLTFMQYLLGLCGILWKLLHAMISKQVLSSPN